MHATRMTNGTGRGNAGIAPARGGRILVADDEPVVREVVRRVLEGEGYEVRTVADGVELFDRALADAPDAVLVDLHMPRVDGVEALAALRRLDPDLEVVAMTGDRTRSSVEAFLAAGAMACLGKPVDLEALTLAVATAVARTRRARAERPEAAPRRARARMTWRMPAAIAASLLAVSLLVIEGLRLVQDEVATRVVAYDRLAERVEGYLARDEAREIDGLSRGGR